VVSTIIIDIEDPESLDARRCLEQYFEELCIRFSAGFDPAADGDVGAATFRSPLGAFLVARRLSRAIGCGGLHRVETRVGEIRRLWVARDSRQLGVGRALLRRLEDEARRMAIETIRLDSHRVLVEAHSLYRAEGYQEVAPFNASPYAHVWFAKLLV